MTEATTQGVLFPDPLRNEGGKVFVNDRCAIQTRDGFTVVTFAGVPVQHYAEGDRAAEAYAMVSLVEQGMARQTEVAQGFNCTTRTVRRYQERFAEEGLAGLGRSLGYPKGRPRLPAKRLQVLSKLKAEGRSNRQIAQRIGVTEKAVRKQLRRLGWKEEKKEQLSLPLDRWLSADPNLSACSMDAKSSTVIDQASPAPAPSDPADPNLSACSMNAKSSTVNDQANSAPVPSDPADPNLSACAQVDVEDLQPTLDTDPADRRCDRVLACLGLLMDAPPFFQNSTAVPNAGVLLAIPAIVDSSLDI